MPVVVVVSFQTRSPKRLYLAHPWSQRHCSECQDVDSVHKMEGKVVVVVSFQTRSPKRLYLAHPWSQCHCSECQDVDSVHKMEGKGNKRIILGISWF
jgi:hypothetical protein